MMQNSNPTGDPFADFTSPMTGVGGMPGATKSVTKFAPGTSLAYGGASGTLSGMGPGMSAPGGLITTRTADTLEANPALGGMSTSTAGDSDPGYAYLPGGVTTVPSPLPSDPGYAPLPGGPIDRPVPTEGPGAAPTPPAAPQSQGAATPFTPAAAGAGLAGAAAARGGTVGNLMRSGLFRRPTMKGVLDPRRFKPLGRLLGGR